MDGKGLPEFECLDRRGMKRIPHMKIRLCRFLHVCSCGDERRYLRQRVWLNISVPLPNELCNSRVGLGQRLLVRQEYDAEVLRARLLAEAGAVHDHDMFSADEFLHEYLVALRDVDARVGVECAARGDAAYTRRRLAPFLGEIAAGAKFALHFSEMVLRPFQRGLDRVLLGMVGAETRSQQTVHALGVGLYRSGFAGDDAPSDAPSGDEIILRHAAEGHAR